ncbi:MAG TPA: hypothetical protein DD381_10810 [Lentisphaeria bacterium]|nr:MAG: hypothetical protein A2X47_00785 [Lentisphaerae bacterium GWF2_38_69]HBM16817.1 hypothetical protein [Lentisphaeria bacterium]
MKTSFFAFLALFITLLIPVYAEDSQVQALDSNKDGAGWWPVLQLVLWPGMPPYTDKEVYGMRTGFPLSGGTGAVYGMELTPFVCYSDYVYGLQISPFFNHTKATNGFRCALANASTEKVKGLQLSTFNYNTKDSDSIDIAFFANITSNYMRGIQVAIVNYAAKSAIQIGVYNQSKTHAFQLGVFNIIEEGYVPFFPVINFW